MRRKDYLDFIINDMTVAEKDIHELRSYMMFRKSDWKYRKNAQEHIHDTTGEPYKYVNYMIYQLRQNLVDIKEYFDLVEDYNKHPDHYAEPPAPPAWYRKELPERPYYQDFY